MFENEEKLLKLLSRYEIELGVVSSDTNRKEKVASIGITNAELMFIHENGSPTRNIPARPVLQMTIDYALSGPLNDEIDFIIDNIFNYRWNESQVVDELNRFCIRLENYARDIIYLNDGRLAPNSEKVAKAKWEKTKHSKKEQYVYPEGNHPLFDTGQLARSITCRLHKK